LFEEEPPSVTQVIEGMMPKLGDLYDSMKAHAQAEMPIDQWFERAFEEYGDKRESDEGGEEEELESSGARSPEVGRASPASVADAAEGDTCDVCNEPMGEGDLSCSHCGATYNDDEDLSLATRPCGNDEGSGCMEKQVPVDANGVGICPQCGTEHTMDEDGVWKVEVPKPIEDEAVADKPKGRRRGRRKSTPTAEETKAEPAPQAAPEKHADARPARRAKRRAQAVAGK